MHQLIFIDKKSIPIHRGHIVWLILCFLLKFITYTAHFCTFICNTTPTQLLTDPYHRRKIS